MRAQLARVAATVCVWPITTNDGYAAESPVHYAHTLSARRFALGRGRHWLTERLFGGETVLDVLRAAETPVLAVEPGLAARPRRVRGAWSSRSTSAYIARCAAQVALTLAAPGASVHLAHVRQLVRLDAARRGSWTRAYDDALPARFVAWRAELASRLGLPFDDVLLTRHPGAALLDFVVAVQADLVASGTHGYGFMNLLLLGSVAVDLLRGAPCSLLCVPGSPVSRVSAHPSSADSPVGVRDVSDGDAD